jgi:nicotinamide-nucleotide amidase
MEDNKQPGKESQIEGFLSRVLSAIGKTTDEELADALKKEGLTVAVAESLTGGLISERLSALPGASEYFIGAIVCYTNRIKVMELAIPPALIAKEGPVSHDVAVLMAENIRKKFKTSIGLSATGVAGPSTTSPPKPIGLTYIAISSDKGTACKELNLQGSRKDIRDKAAQGALGLLWLHINEQSLEK